MRNSILIALVSGIVVLAGAVYFLGGEQTVEFGGSTSADWSANSFQVNGTEVISSSRSASLQELTQGGGVVSITNDDGTETLTESQLLNNNYLKVTPEDENLTLTLPATSTMTTLIPNAGDMREWVIENAASAATTTTIAAGTGIDLQEPDGQNVVIGQNNFARLTCIRQETSQEVMCVVDETIPAD